MNELFRGLLYLPEQASSVAREIDTLHYFVITVTMLGATAVFLTALWFLIRYRRRADELTPRITTPRKLETGLITMTLGLFLLWWVIGFRQYILLTEPPVGALDVYVMGKQWMWKFAYPGGRASVGVLAVPVGRPVRLVMTSRDVIHSFYIPSFRIKHDVVPGRYVTTWFEAIRPGTYDVFCAEYCGLSHSRMRAAVVALPPAEYAAWLEQAEVPGASNADGRMQNADEFDEENSERVDMAETGRRVAVRRGCFGCHTADGQPHIGPSWRGRFGTQIELVGGQTILADEAYLTRSMMEPGAHVAAGFAPVMPTYQGVLEAGETAALVEYIKSLRGPVTPSVLLPKIDPRGIVPADAGTSASRRGADATGVGRE